MWDTTFINEPGSTTEQPTTKQVSASKKRPHHLTTSQESTTEYSTEGPRQKRPRVAKALMIEKGYEEEEEEKEQEDILEQGSLEPVETPDLSNITSLSEEHGPEKPLTGASSEAATKQRTPKKLPRKKLALEDEEEDDDEEEEDLQKSQGFQLTPSSSPLATVSRSVEHINVSKLKKLWNTSKRSHHRSFKDKKLWQQQRATFCL